MEYVVAIVLVAICVLGAWLFRDPPHVDFTVTVFDRHDLKKGDVIELSGLAADAVADRVVVRRIWGNTVGVARLKK